MGRNKIKYKFTKDKAVRVREKLQLLENKKYLDKSGQIKTVKKVIITPYNGILLAQFLKEPNLFAEHDELLEKYPIFEYAILFFLESSSLYIQNLTIEEFEVEFGLPPHIMEMIVDLSKDDKM